MKRIGFDECDSTEEVCGFFNKVFENMEQMETKIIQLDKQVETLKSQMKSKFTKSWITKLLNPKKKGSKMKNGFATKQVVAILMVLAAIVSVCFAAYVPGDITSEIAANSDMLSVYLRDVTNNMRSFSYVFTPRAAAPTPAAEGMVYYNDGTNKWVGYNGAAWLDFDVAGGVTLNGAYDSGGAGLGRTIDVTDSTVLFAATNAADNVAFTVTQADNNGNTQAMQITHAGAGATYISLDIDSQATGRDVEGTGATWYVTGAGAHTAASADFTGAAGITLQNDETITNAADGKITFTTNGGTANTLLFDLQAGATAIQLESGDVTELQFGTVDNLTEIGNITFDADPAAITLTGDGGGDDLTITQAGAVDASVVVHSAGTNLDAIKIHTDGDGGIDIDADEDIAITVTSDAAAEDLLITQSGAQNAGIVLTSDGTGAIAIKLETTSATGDIWLDSGDDLDIDVAGKIDIDLVGDYELDVAAGINITSSEAADGAITIATSDAAGNIIITSTDATADALDINTTAGGIDIDAALAIAIDNSGAGSDISITSALGSVNIIATENAVDSILIQSSVGGIDIDAAAATGEDIDITNTGGSINLVATESAVDSIKLQSTLGGIDIQCDASTSEDIDISNTGGSINLVATENAADSIKLQSTLGGIDILADASGDEDIDISNTGGNVHITSDADATDAFNLDVTGTDGGVDIDTTDGPIHLVTAGAINGDISLDASDNITIVSSDADAAGITIQTDGGAAETIYINSTAGTTASAIYLDADVGGITLLADGVTAGDILLDAEDQIKLTTDDENAAAIDIGVAAGGAAASTIVITNTPGTGAAAIALVGTAGGVEIDAAAAKIIALDGGSVTIDSKTAGAAAIALTSNQGAADTITIDVIQGTATATTAESLQLTSTDGGIGLYTDTSTAKLEAAAAITLLANAGGIAIRSQADIDPSVQIISDGGTAEKMLIWVDQGEAADALKIICDDGGIEINAEDDILITMDSTAGADDLVISKTGGQAASIEITSDGTSTDAIKINATGGGFELTGTVASSTITQTATGAADDLTISQVGNTDSHLILASAGTSIDSIYIQENGAGTGGGIKLHADTGTGEASIHLLSDGGGIDMDGSTGKNITMNAGQILIEAEDDTTSAISLITNTGTAETIVIDNQQGNTSTSIDIKSTAGGIQLDAGADDAITLTAGTAGVVFTNGQTRKLMFLPKTVELDGANAPALGSVGTNAQYRFAVLQFDANPNATGDDMCYISWMVPDGYILDSARLNIAYSFSTAEAAADECQFDFTINSVAPGEILDAAGTALDDQATSITAANTDNGKLHVSQYNIDGTAEVIAIDDLVTIKILVDEDQCEMDASGTLDIYYFEIEWESTE